MTGRAQTVLSFGDPRESGGKDETVAQVDGASRFGTFMAYSFLYNKTEYQKKW